MVILLKIEFLLLHWLIFLNWRGIFATNVTNEHYVALILARGGSKGIPLKNLAVVENKSLLRRTIETALHSKIFHSVWVSTDYLNIYQEAERAGANVFARSTDTATDTVSSLDAVVEFYDFFPNITVLALLQCTSPFQSVFALREAYRMMQTARYDSVFSVTPSYKLRWRYTQVGWQPINFRTENRPRRQDMKREYIENGMFYWFRTELLARRVLQGGRAGAVVIPIERSLEIDTHQDLTYANFLAKYLLPSLENEQHQCSPNET